MRISGRSASVRSWGKEAVGDAFFQETEDMAICPVAGSPGFPTVPGRDLLHPLFSLPEREREREDPFPYTANKQVYGLVRGGSGAGLLTACGLWAGKSIPEHFISWLTGFEFWVWQWDCLLFQSNSLSGCLLKTFVVWTEIGGRGRSHLFWNSLPITWSNYCRAKWRESNRKFLSGASSPNPLSQAIVLTWRPTCSFQRPGPVTRRTNRRRAEKAKEERVGGSFPTSSPCHSAQVKPPWIWIKKWTFSLLEGYTSLIAVSFIISNEKVTFLYKLDSWFLFVDVLFVFRVFNLFISLKIWEQYSCFWNVGCLNLQNILGSYFFL